MKNLLSYLKRNINRGMSLTEIVIWVAMVGIFASLIIVGGVTLINKARIYAAKQELNTFSAALMEYYQDTGTFPSENDGLEVLYKEGYIINGKGKDPWKNDYIYTLSNNSNDFILKSLGRNKDDEKDDIISTSNQNLIEEQMSNETE